MTKEMALQEILKEIGEFSPFDMELFGLYTLRKTLGKNETLLKEGEICKSVYYVFSGSFIQYQTKDITETIIDLHTQNEWVFNHQSLVEQTTSNTTIKSFEKSEVLELTLTGLHSLISKSQVFLKFASILNQAGNRTHIFDNSLNPAERYEYIKKTKPNLVKVFPVRLIASYLKMAPETLSRVRAKY